MIVGRDLTDFIKQVIGVSYAVTFDRHSAPPYGSAQNAISTFIVSIENPEVRSLSLFHKAVFDIVDACDTGIRILECQHISAGIIRQGFGPCLSMPDEVVSCLLDDATDRICPV